MQFQVSVCLTRLTHLTLSHCSWVSGASIEFLAFHHRLIKSWILVFLQRRLSGIVLPRTEHQDSWHDGFYFWQQTWINTKSYWKQGWRGDPIFKGKTEFWSDVHFNQTYNTDESLRLTPNHWTQWSADKDQGEKAIKVQKFEVEIQNIIFRRQTFDNSRYAGKDKLFHDLHQAAYITKIRRKQCRWETSMLYFWFEYANSILASNWALIHCCPIQSIHFIYFHPFSPIPTGSQWRLGKRHPGLQALFLSDCSPSISDQDVCRLWNYHCHRCGCRCDVILLQHFFVGCIALALLWTLSMQAGILLPLPGGAGHRPEPVADWLLPVLSCQVNLLL